MPPQGSLYVDVPLNFRRKHIRLVTLEPGNAPGPIECSLQSHALDDECPEYVALSSAWGTKQRYGDVQINGSTVPVGRNLWCFLHEMRLQRQHVTFWIDAICIDQANVLEQNHQVQMMREIYRQACSVWVWLGEADESTLSDVAMQYLSTRVAFSDKDMNSKKLWNARKAKAVLGLCEREYWRRIWIVQEILLAKEAKILCGSQCVAWIKLQQLLVDLHAISDRGRSVHVIGVLAVLDSPAAIIIRAKAQWNGVPRPLTALLEQYYGHHSTNVRDKVYALHGLASDSYAIAIDYEIDPGELLIQIVYHACSPRASNMDRNRSKRSILGFAKLMRESLKVFCDEQELHHHVSMAQRNGTASATYQAAVLASMTPHFKHSSNEAQSSGNLWPKYGEDTLNILASLKRVKYLQPAAFTQRNPSRVRRKANGRRFYECQLYNLVYLWDLNTPSIYESLDHELDTKLNRFLREFSPTTTLRI